MNDKLSDIVSEMSEAQFTDNQQEMMTGKGRVEFRRATFQKKSGNTFGATRTMDAQAFGLIEEEPININQTTSSQIEKDKTKAEPVSHAADNFQQEHYMVMRMQDSQLKETGE